VSAPSSGRKRQYERAVLEARSLGDFVLGKTKGVFFGGTMFLDVRKPGGGVENQAVLSAEVVREKG